MAMTRCPLCGGNVSGGICESCGYELPDEEEIVRPYDYIPDRVEEDEDKTVDMPEIYPNGLPNIKAAKPNEPPAPKPYIPQNNVSVQQVGSAQQPNKNININQNAMLNQPAKQQNPYNAANTNPYQNYSGLTTGEKIVKITSDLLKRYGIMMFASVFIPVLALPFGIYAMFSVQKKGRKYDIFAVIWFMIIFGLLYIAGDR